jgi:hypothetical protein
VVAIDRAPFTDEEKTRIKDGNIQEKLEEHRRGHTPEEIKAMLAKANGGDDSNDSPSSAPQSAPAATNATQESSSGADDDLDF